MFPIRLGTDAEFAALRKALLACDYTEAAICANFQVQRVAELREPGRTGPTTGAVSLLARLLITGETIPDSPLLPLRELQSLGVVTADSGQFTASVMLYPARNLYIVSDLGNLALDDVVYPAIGTNTEIFLDHVPDGPCKAFLDLCAGTGIAALAAAQNGAAHAWAFDITARSTHFAEFNRRLNNVPNLTTCQGDLYAPAADQTFDRIVAHPPYLPVYRPHFVFDSGGQDGEQIVRRIVEGLPKYLRPGGKFFALTMGTDREQPFELRLREWLGDAAQEFDIALVVRRTLSPRDYSADSVVLHKGSAEDITGWRELFQQWGVRSLVYGFVVLQRRASDRPVFTVRREASPRTGPAELAWLVEWSTEALHPETLLPRKPRARQNLSLLVEHRLADSAWHPQTYRFESDHPFHAVVRAEPWAPHLLALADGSITLEQLLAELIAAGALPGSVPPLEFSSVIAAMISAGLLEI